MLLSHLADAHVEIDYILLCETFRNDDNAPLFKQHNYNLIYKNRKIKSKSGVAVYGRDNILVNLPEDYSIYVEGEFESTFIESSSNGHTEVVGELYRIHNHNS